MTNYCIIRKANFNMKNPDTDFGKQKFLNET